MSSSYRSNLRPGSIALPADWRTATLWLLVAGLLQATVVHFVAIRGAVPSLIVLVVATYAVRAGMPGALLLGAAGGLLDDALAGNTGAAWTIATTVVAAAIVGSSRFLFTDSFSIFTVIVIVAALAREALYWAVLSLEGYQVGLGVHFMKIACASALYTGLVAAALAWLRWRFSRS